MKNWKKILKLIKKWTEDIDDRSQDLFIEELNNQYILIKRSDADKIIMDARKHWFKDEGKNLSNSEKKNLTQ